MKRIAIALILLAAAPAVASASSSLIDELAGRGELVADSTPGYYADSSSDVVSSAKSSRPQLQRKSLHDSAPPLDSKLSAGWL